MEVRPSFIFSTQAPYASAVAWSSSERSGNVRWNFALNRPWLAASSGLIPQTVAPAATSSSFASRNAQASVVQPGVSSFG